jgi:biopolymer transport protein ExbD
MPAKRRSFDVWIVETNAVYTRVPYTVVSDWLQQGRLLEEDKLRPAGAGDWVRLDALPEFAPYFPKSDPHRADDRAEALVPVQVDFTWKPRVEDGDEDVDMIPLIDVSLVLLIFFMMTATVATAGSFFINTPEARYGTQTMGDLGMLWIGIERGVDGKEVYSLGHGDQAPREGNQRMTEEHLLERLDEALDTERLGDVTIKADRDLPYEVVKRLTVALEVRKAKGRVRRTFAGVSERESP